MRLQATLKAHAEAFSLLALTFAFFLLRLPSLVEPYWYGDEGVYQTIGIALRQGRELYSGIWDNKPPLLYVLYALFNGDQFSLRFVSLLFGIGSLIAFFFLAKNLLVKRQAVYAATAAFALLFSLPFTEANIANAENFMLLPILLAALFVTNVSDKNRIFPKILHNRYQVLLSAGLFIGIAFLFKIVAFFDFAAFFLFLVLIQIHKKPLTPIPSHYKTYMLQTVKATIPFVGGFIFPILLTTLYFSLSGGLEAFLQAMVFENIGYVNYRNEFLIPHGLLLLKFGLLAVFLSLLFVYRRSLPLSAHFILIWTAFSLFNAYFSHRPYTHYILVTLPSISLLLGLSIAYFKKPYTIPLLFLLVFFILNHQFKLTDTGKYKKTGEYYQNFFAFIGGQKNMTEYQRFFDSDVPRDYDVARYLKSQPDKDQGVFIWGNSAQIYALSGTLPPGRYTVAYHIAYGNEKAKHELQGVLDKEKPQFIVIMPDIKEVPFSLQGYEHRVLIKDTGIYERSN